MGTLVHALHVGNGCHLELCRLRIRNYACEPQFRHFRMYAFKHASQRHCMPHADEPDGAQAVLDMGTLVDAIHVGDGSHLELRRLRIPNCASRHVRASPPPRVRLRVAGIFALWPSITLAINSSVRTLRSATLHVGCL